MQLSADWRDATVSNMAVGIVCMADFQMEVRSTSGKRRSRESQQEQEQDKTIMTRSQKERGKLGGGGWFYLVRSHSRP